METLALVIILFGLLIAASRMPLIFFPRQTRDFYAKAFATDARMRLLGVMVVIIGIILVGAASGASGTPANIVFGLGIFLIALGALFFMALPGPARRLALSIWGSFSDGALRALGAVAVAIGLLIAAYGLTLN